MAARADIVEKYEVAGTYKKIRLIIEHYSYWDGILEACIGNMVDDILDEIRYNRRAEYGDLGVRIKTSGLGNPTENQGINEMEIEKAVKNCDFSGGVLNDTDDSEKYIRKAFVIRQIRTDIDVFNRQFKFLNTDEQKDLKDFISGRRKIWEFSEKWNVLDDSAYKRLERLMKVVKQETAAAMERRHD